VKGMDEAGVEKVIVLTEAIGPEFDKLADLYQKTYPDRFQLWCGLDIRDFENPDYPERAGRTGALLPQGRARCGRTFR